MTLIIFVFFAGARRSRNCHHYWYVRQLQFVNDVKLLTVYLYPISSSHCTGWCYTDPSKQFAVPATPRDQSLLQPLGVPVAMAAATVMAGALGSAQAASTNMVGLQNQTPLGTDSLTQYLAKMSSSQLTGILSELKVSLLNKIRLLLVDS